MKKSMLVVLMGLFAATGAMAGQCDGAQHLPQWSQIEFDSLCQVAALKLGKPNPQIFFMIQKATHVLQFRGSRTSPRENAKSLAEIVLRRGHRNDPAAATADLDVAVKVYTAFDGKFTPGDIALLLRDSGALARTLDDDGLINVIAVQKQMWQQTGEWDSRSPNR